MDGCLGCFACWRRLRLGGLTAVARRAEAYIAAGSRRQQEPGPRGAGVKKKARWSWLQLRGKRSACCACAGSVAGCRWRRWRWNGLRQCVGGVRAFRAGSRRGKGGVTSRVETEFDDPTLLARCSLAVLELERGFQAALLSSPPSLSDTSFFLVRFQTVLLGFGLLPPFAFRVVSVLLSVRLT